MVETTGLLITLQVNKISIIRELFFAANTVTSGVTGGRKRPLLPGGGTRVAMSPTKRTVLSILARARAAQAKELLSAPYQPLAHIASVWVFSFYPHFKLVLNI